MSNQFRFVCATRESAEGFSKTPLGQSLSLYQYPHTSVRLFPDNRLGLSTVYNMAIREAETDPAILLFAHDDIYICDFFWPFHVLGSLSQFDILGVAGNRRRAPAQASWRFLDDRLTVDSPDNQSGIVGHGDRFPPDNVSLFGIPGVEVKLLDGVLLVARSEALLQRKVFFDEQFAFHFYDMDFCRQAEAAGLRLGTTLLSLVHQSEGNFNHAWRAGYQTYLAKWGD